jgi:putative transcriptional regulator
MRGRLLVAAPPLVDPNFDRTVVLLLEHGEDGSLGLVLNRPGTVDLEEAVPEWQAFAAAPRVVFVGGPVSPEAVIALALGGSVGEGEGWVPVIGDLGTVDLARRPSELPARIDAMRIFIGYAGWAPGQLQSELDRSAWFVVDFEIDDAFTEDPTSLWRAVLRRQPGRVAIFANCPDDPGTN